MFKKLSFYITIVFVFLQTFVFAFADPLDRLGEEIQSETAQEIGWGILTPLLKIVAIVFFVLGILAIIIAVLYLLLRGIKMLFGKGSLGKSEIGKAFTVLVIGVLISGGSWVGVVNLGNNVLVKPVSDEIIEKSSGSTKKQSQTKEKTESEENKTQDESNDE